MIEKDSLKVVYCYDLQLFAKDGPNGEKTEEPTSKKLSNARKKGQVGKSKEVTTAAMLLTFFVLLKFFIGYLGGRFLSCFEYVFKHISEYGNDEFTVPLSSALMGDMVKYILITGLPFYAVIFVVAFISQMAQIKWKVSFEPMKPKFSKFNPISGVKRIFSKNKLFETLFDTAKLVILCAVVISYLKDKWDLVMKMYSYTLTQGIALIGDIIIDIGMRVSMWFIVIGAADFAYQKWKFHDDMKMTKQEVKDEFKNSEGDPKVKSQQRARMQQASRRRMMQSVPQADVVITNPTHFAVAIKYDKNEHEAPIVLAKGADYLAHKIKDVAAENSIEIVENKPLARMLYHNVDIGAEIPPELYQMVAEVLAYVYNLKGKS